MDPMMGGMEGSSPPPGAPDSDAQFEQDFARMAFASLEDRAAKLIPHLVAFETVRKEEDGTAAVGMFGFDIGNKFYYIPVFFRNGRVADVDIILDKQENVMMPLQEASIAKLLNQELVTLGQATSVPNTGMNGFESPNLDFVANPPFFKHASEQVRTSRNGSYVAYHTQARASKQASDSFDTEWSQRIKEAAEHARLRACTVVRDMPEFCTPLFSKLAGVDAPQPESELKAFLRQAGPGATNCVLKTAGTAPEFAAALYSVYPDIEEIVPEAYEGRKLAGDIWLFEDGQRLPAGIPAEKVAEIRARGWAIVDKRKRTGELNEVDLEEVYGSPSEPGKYKVYLEGGDTEECTVVPYQGGVAVISADGKKSFTCAKDILCVQLNTHKELPTDAGIKVTEIQPGRKYVLAHPSACDGYVFECEALDKDDGQIACSIWCRTYPEHGHNQLTNGGGSPDRLRTVDYADKNCTLVRTPNGCERTLYVPSDWRVIELDKGKREQRDADRGSDEESADVPYSHRSSPSFHPGCNDLVSKLAAARRK